MLKIGDRVVLPNPTGDDAWTEGGFLARVAEIRQNGNIIVVDQDDDAWEIENHRLAIAEVDGGC